MQWLRTRRPYRWFFWFLTQRLLPGVFLVVVVFAVLALLSQATFTARDALRQVCAGSEAAKPISSHAEKVPFRANALCTPTNLKLEESATYRLFIVIPAADPWIDNSVPAKPYGVPRSENLLTDENLRAVSPTPPPAVAETHRSDQKRER